MRRQMSNSGKKPTDDDEVEQLLRAAQDDVLLKLSVHSHMARGSASAAIDPDLDRRFQALRKPQNPPAKIGNSANKAPPETDKDDNEANGVPTEDDLFARFAALRKSLPSYIGNEDKSEESVNNQPTEEDEVEKIMNWAIDAARLDPSPLSDDDDASDDDYDDDSDDDRGKKGKRK